MRTYHKVWVVTHGLAPETPHAWSSHLSTDMNTSAGTLREQSTLWRMACLEPSLNSQNQLAQVRLRRPPFDQMILNRYSPGEGIKPHIDLARFADGICIVSVGSCAALAFSQACVHHRVCYRDDQHRFLLELRFDGILLLLQLAIWNWLELLHIASKAQARPCKCTSRPCR